MEAMTEEGASAMVEAVAVHKRRLWKWYAACAADAFRSKDEDVLMRQVGEVLKEQGVDLGLPPVLREEL